MLVGCGTNEIGGAPAEVTGERISLSAEVPACGHPEFVHYADGTVGGEDNEPGYVAATGVGNGTGTLLLDGDKHEVSEGDVLDARDGRLRVVSIVDGEPDEEKIVVEFLPGGVAHPAGLRADAASAGFCPPPE